MNQGLTVTELWKPIPSEPGYEVSDLGRVRSADRVVETAASWRRPAHKRTYKGKLLKPGRMSGGHWPVACGKGNTRTVHSLVLEAFVGPCPPGMECLRGGDDNDDNSLTNLRYGTRSENLIEAWANGRMR